MSGFSVFAWLSISLRTVTVRVCGLTTSPTYINLAEIGPWFSAVDKTLTDVEIDAMMKKLVQEFEKNLQAEIRK